MHVRREQTAAMAAAGCFIVFLTGVFYLALLAGACYIVKAFFFS